MWKFVGISLTSRLRDLVGSKLYTFEKPGQHPDMKKLLKGRIHMKVIQEIYYDVLRLAYPINYNFFL
ncbi:Tn3 family transposase [Bacillus sp. JJ864]|uniref:Tn3 family transposase n=1 Tax=Bacillus sp. JJ864 TaxID=3122975 RepID=UPI0012B692A4